MVVGGGDQGSSEPAGGFSSLSRREREVVAHLARGLSRAAIAKELYRSPKTIDNHCTRIYRKLGVQSQAQLVSFVFEQGWAKQLDSLLTAAHPYDRIKPGDRVYQAIGAIDRRLAGAPSDRFFSELVLALAETLGTEMCGVSEADESADEVVIIVATDRGELIDQMEFPIEATACGKAFEFGEFACERDARAAFPESTAFQVAQIESCAGVRLESSAFGRIGCLWVADRKPIKDTVFALDVLRFMRRRVSSELALQIAIDRLDELGAPSPEAIDLVTD